MKLIENEITESFESLVLNNLLEKMDSLQRLKGLRIGAGISGGADSISLLISLSRLSKKYGFQVFVLTVNHNVRESSVSLEDSLFVLEICDELKKLNFPVYCEKYDIPEGKVFAFSDEKKCGTEDSARILRYEAFSSFIKSNSLDLFCLAHNYNDQLETVLMRFLSGSGSGGLSGIKSERGIFFRPVLNISRFKIEEYVNQFGTGWRIDASNEDQHYLRNKIRHGLVPVLQEKFPGWEKSVLRSARKASVDEDYFNQAAGSFIWNVKTEGGKKSASGNGFEFKKFHQAVGLRILQKGFNLAGYEERLSYGFTDEFFRLISENKDDFSLEINGYKVTFSGGLIRVELNELVATESAFFVIIEEDGEFELPFGSVSVRCRNGSARALLQGKDGSVELENISVPFCVRSRLADDQAASKNGGMKSVSDIFSDWHVCVENKQKIPVVQELTGNDQKIICIAGSVLGYKDWILRGY